MAEFVRAQIFGTTFEITSRFVARDPEAAPRQRAKMREEGLTSADIPICSQWAWELLDSYGAYLERGEETAEGVD